MNVRFAAWGFAALCASALLPVVPAHGQENGALLDALVKKGVLSDQEAEDIRASEEKDYASTAASKINLSSSIKSITFYGDLRLRYELRDGTVDKGDVGGGGALFTHDDSQTRSRWRYRLRFGVKGDLYDQFFYGIRLATNPNYDRSGNVTFGDSDSEGPFGKDKSLLAIDQVYLGWKPTSDITLTGGKMPNPLYTTNLVWDDNLNPEGAAEQFDHSFDNGLEVFATAGQFVYGDSADNSAYSGVPGSNFDDIFMFTEQVGVKYKIDDDTAFKGAVTLYTYSGTQNGTSATVTGLYGAAPLNEVNGSTTATASTSSLNNDPSFFNGPFVGAAQAPATNVTGINNLAVLETPLEFDFKAWKVPMRFFGDFAYNFEASARADTARQVLNSTPLGGSNDSVTALSAAELGSNDYQGVLHSGKALQDQIAYQLGYEAGVLKKKGDWQTRLYWQSTGYYAVDPNLIDSDIFTAAPNMQGAVVSGSYNWTDGLTSTVRYAHGMPVNDRMATPNVNQDLALSTMHTYDLLQLDLMWKF
jgi:hypothetical protein